MMVCELRAEIELDSCECASAIMAQYVCLAWVCASTEQGAFASLCCIGTSRSPLGNEDALEFLQGLAYIRDTERQPYEQCPCCQPGLQHLRILLSLTVAKAYCRVLAPGLGPGAGYASLRALKWVAFHHACRLRFSRFCQQFQRGVSE